MCHVYYSMSSVQCEVCRLYVEEHNKTLEEVPMKISRGKVPLKIDSKVDAFKNIIMEISL